jgi:uncharacterized integral membrane protein
MSTPPPPMPASSSPAPAQQPALSEPARLINVFIAPTKTFIDLRRNASWWVPWLVGAVFSVIFAVVAVQKLDMVNLVRQGIEHSSMAQRRMEQFTPEQRETMIERQATITKGFFYMSPILGLIFGIIIAAILMAVFNFGFAAEVPFQRAMAITFYSFLPVVIKSLLMIISILASSDPNSMDFGSGNPIATTPGFFMDPNSNKFLYTFASGLDVFVLWPVVLLGLGFAVASSNRKLKPSTGIITTLVLYGLFLVGRAGLAAAF